MSAQPSDPMPHLARLASAPVVGEELVSLWGGLSWYRVTRVEGDVVTVERMTNPAEEES